jgi:hypothetical protein
MTFVAVLVGNKNNKEKRDAMHKEGGPHVALRAWFRVPRSEC